MTDIFFETVYPFSHENVLLALFGRRFRRYKDDGIKLISNIDLPPPPLRVSDIL
jgi:hypothetical protein